MPDSPESIERKRSTFDPSIQTENIAYAAEEFLLCDSCSRQNPPNRTNCLYCGAELAITAAQFAGARPLIRALEPWEQGFNVIYRAKKSADEVSIKNIASFLSLEMEEVEAMLGVNSPLPVARVESFNLAEILVGELGKLGLSCSVVGDADLAADKPLVRLATMEISETAFHFIDFNTRLTTEVPFGDLVLIVRGHLSNTRTDLVEKRKRKGAVLLDETSSFADEPVIDLYTRSDNRGFRINLAGFDYSCLGPEKTFLAKDNIGQLVKLVSALAPNARLVDDYSSVKRSLAIVWEIESRSDAQGIKRLGIGKSGFGKIESTSNLRQFTKYSRLQWHLL